MIPGSIASLNLRLETLRVWTPLHRTDDIRRLRLDQILLHAQVLDDELLPLLRVLSHEEREQFVGAVEVVEVDRVEGNKGQIN